MGHMEPREVTLPGGECITIRTADASDAEAMLEHALRNFGTDQFRITEQDEFEAEYDVEKERQMLVSNLEQHNSIILVACLDGRIVGDVMFRGGKRRRMSHAGTFGIAVTAAHRGKGIGRALIEALLDWARAHPTIEKVGLGVVADNVRARRLYESMGFKVDGIQHGYFKYAPGKYWDDVQMSMWVKGGPGGDGDAR